MPLTGQGLLWALSSVPLIGVCIRHWPCRAPLLILHRWTCDQVTWRSHSCSPFPESSSCPTLSIFACKFENQLISTYKKSPWDFDLDSCWPVHRLKTTDGFTAADLSIPEHGMCPHSFRFYRGLSSRCCRFQPMHSMQALCRCLLSIWFSLELL